ncbi:MAG: hypothetical protein ACC657_10955 [Thiohalomonadales bacterium]
MSMYILSFIWLISAGICYFIAKRKNIRLTVVWNIIFVLLGPIAIPIIMMTKSNSVNEI